MINNTFNLRKAQEHFSDWYDEDIALKTQDPAIIRRVLEFGKSDIVSENAVKNPNCPPVTLRMVLERGNDDIISRHAASSRNCPPDALIMVLERGENNMVSRAASENPNCNLEIKLKWMESVGKIESEDPERHIVDYSEEKDNNDKDEDLEHLRGLISKVNVFNLKTYKIAKYEDEWKDHIEMLAKNNPFPFKNLFPNGGNRLYFPFSGKQDEEVDSEIEEILKEYNFEITDYRKGYCSDGSNIHKIGKILRKIWSKEVQKIHEKNNNNEIYDLERELQENNNYFQSIIKQFENSPLRTSKGESNFSVVISQDPHDVAKMSTDRSWTSCMELGSGSNHKDIFCEVQEGGLVAYLIKSNDKEIEEPLARIRIRRFSDEDGRDIMLPEDSVYGNPIEGFSEFVKNWVDSVQGEISYGLYYLKGGEYSDTFGDSMFTMPSIPQEVVNLWKGNVDESKFIKYKVSDNLDGEYNMYDGEVHNGEKPRYFKTKEEAEEYVYNVSTDDSWREEYGEEWLETDEDGGYLYQRYDINKKQLISKESIKTQAASSIIDAPKGTYPTEVINEIKDWALTDMGWNSSKRGIINKILKKYPELATFSEVEFLGKEYEYEYIKNMPEGPEKDLHKQNILREIERRLSNFEYMLEGGNETVRTPSVRLLANFTSFVVDPLRDLFNPIPENIVNRIIEFSNKVLNQEFTDNEEIRERLELDKTYKDSQGNIINPINSDENKMIIDRAINLFTMTKSDTPSVQKFYEDMLKYWGYNFKNIHGVDQPYSNINVNNLGYAIARLGENGARFLPFIKDRLKNEQEIYNQVDESRKPYIKKNIEKYLHIIDSIENKTGYSKKYRFSKKFKLFKKKSQVWSDSSSSKYHINEEVIKAENTKDPNVLMDILEKGKNDYASQRAAKNSICPPDALRMVLKRGENDDVSRYAAENENCPPDVLYEVLKRDKDDIVSEFAAVNPNCPPDALRMVIKRDSTEHVLGHAISNPNCPPDALAMVLDRGEDNVYSKYALINPNCPIDAKIRWMERTGKIETEDPRRHIIDYSEDKSDNNEDDGLDYLRGLISKSSKNSKRKIFNLRKAKEQFPEWYNVETAKGTDDPEVLMEILKFDRDDNVSYYAAKNPNCSPEALRMVIKNEHQHYASIAAVQHPNCPPDALHYVLISDIYDPEDSVSKFAAMNENCSPETLSIVLEKGKDDATSWNAAKNPNCPPEALYKVLIRGYDDYVSYFAAKNPNITKEIIIKVLGMGIDNDASNELIKNPKCPVETRIKWMEDTGKIESEDPEKHIFNYEEDEQEKSNDLDSLKSLIS